MTDKKPQIRPSVTGQLYIVHLFAHHGLTPKQITEHIKVIEPEGWADVKVVKDVLTDRGFKV